MFRKQLIWLFCIMIMALVLGACGLAQQRRRQEAFDAAFKEAARISFECKDKRLRGELAGKLASVRCSNDRMRQVIAASGWPHMDLEDLRLAYRAAVAKREDEGTMSEEEADAKLAELNVRINAEIQRRNALAHDMYLREQQVYHQGMQSMGVYLQGLGAWQQSQTPPQTPPQTTRSSTITCYNLGDVIRCN